MTSRRKRAVLDRPTVFVPAAVDRAAEELREDVAVAGVQLDAIRSCLQGATRCSAKPADDLGDLRARRFLPAQTVEEVRLVGRGVRPAGALVPHPVLHARNVLLPAGVRKLKNVLTVERVDLPDELPPERDALVAVDRRVVRQDAPADVHGRVRRDDRPDAASREPLLEVDPRSCPGAVVVVDAAGDTRADQPILDRHGANAERLEEDVVLRRPADPNGAARVLPGVVAHVELHHSGTLSGSAAGIVLPDGDNVAHLCAGGLCRANAIVALRMAAGYGAGIVSARFRRRTKRRSYVQCSRRTWTGAWTDAGKMRGPLRAMARPRLAERRRTASGIRFGPPVNVPACDASHTGPYLQRMLAH